MQAQVRSGRSLADDAREAPREVVVVGHGPVAVGVAAVLSARLSARSGGVVRMLDAAPDDEPGAAFAGADAVVLASHTGDLGAALTEPSAERRAAAVADAERVLAGARAARVPQVVAITSAMVHGAAPQQPPLPEDAPLISAAEAGDGVVGDLLAVEAVLARAARRRGGPRGTGRRPAPIGGPAVDTMLPRHFEAPRLLTVRGVEREWQFTHVDDLGSAVALVVDQRLRGPFTVGHPDVLTAREVEAAAGMRRIELAAVTAFGTAERLHRVGALPAPAAELAYTVYPWTVTGAGLLAAGWEPRWSAAQCVDALLEGVQGRTALAGRRLGARDAAAVGAAGAAVAMIGTAAVWRRARARRRP
ncbi:Rossmann-fold NAD(P)-binding domain-containing protein [Cellulomonas timonensis]|uniref:nucleoside-diphosphate sugar epimerase n=1 Tax=Cellulomonas timonensis TaxID=1689271 RepID=UPI0008346D07|nr:nucleoside-diphosphate sugar epimerase [Cellulomonas timonensis]